MKLSNVLLLGLIYGPDNAIGNSDGLTVGNSLSRKRRSDEITGVGDKTPNEGGGEPPSDGGDEPEADGGDEPEADEGDGPPADEGDEPGARQCSFDEPHSQLKCEPNKITLTVPYCAFVKSNFNVNHAYIGGDDDSNKKPECLGLVYIF